MDNPNRYSLSVAFETGHRKGRWRRLIQRYRFDSEELESLYQRYIYKMRLSSVVALLVLFILLTATLGILNFVFVSHVTVKNIYHLSQCGISVLLLVFIHTKFMKESHMLPLTCIIWVLCLSFSVVAMPVNFGDRPKVVHTHAEGVWQIMLVVFLIYSLMPLKIYVAMTTGILLPMAHVLITIMLPQSFPWLLWRQVTANVIMFLAVNMAGVYIHDRTEHAQRKAFLDTRNCITARLDMQDENEKMERLLLSVLPQHVAMEMKQQVLTPNQGLFNDAHVQTFDNVSILFADIVGFTSLASLCTAPELVKILNEIFSKFDDLAEENNCLRIKVLGDNYFCVSGLPEPCPDHAASCVQMGLDMVDLINALRETTDVDLTMRIGVHTGRVVCGVMGMKKWQYDVWSDDVIAANYVEATGLPGRVQISNTTLSALGGRHQVEVCGAAERSAFLRERGMTTYLVVPAHQPKENSLMRGKTSSGKVQQLRSMTSPIVRLMCSLKFSAEPPFSYVYHTLHDDRLNKIGDKRRKQHNKKRTSSLQRGYGDRVNNVLSHAITTRSIKREKRDHVSLATLRFRSSIRESLYQNREDTSFATNMLCSLILLVCAATVQAIVLPRTLLLLVLFLVTFAWISTILIIVLGTKLRCMKCNIQKNSIIRLLVMLITILLIYSVSQVNVFCCRGGMFFNDLETNSKHIIAFNRNEHLTCDMPEYVFLAGILGYIATAVFLKLSALAKLLLMILMTGGYLVVMEYSHPPLFEDLDRHTNPDIPSHVMGVVSLLSFLLTLYIHSRHQEWTYRLDFLWKNQATEEKIEMTELQTNNRQILCNLLPAHVAAHYVDLHHRTHMDLYGQAYQRVGVLFASIPNMADLYVEMASQNKHKECLQLLHEIISNFDELLLEDRFRGIDKIKTCGATYMAVVGLPPDRAIQDTDESSSTQLSVLVEFYFAMKSKLQSINENSGYSFSLRAGAHVGPVVAGVVGAKRPQYDLFGSTVNVASTMEATSKPDFIQVTEEVYRALFQKFEFQNKGTLQLKHKGPTTTYLVIGRKTVYSPSQVMLQNLSTLEWRHAGVQLRNQSKRSSLHEAFNRRSRPISFHQSKENVNQCQSPASANKNRYSTESPKLQLQQLQEILGTPPGSLTRKHRNSGGGGSGSGSKDNVNKTSDSKMPTLMSAPENMLARVGSPELPLVHYRNTNMQGGSGTLGRQQQDPSAANTRTLTQSQILHARCESRCQSRASIGSKNDVSPSKESTDITTTDGLGSSRYDSVTSTPSSVHTSPGSSSSSDPTAPPQFSIGPPESRRLIIQPPPPLWINGYSEPGANRLEQVPEFAAVESIKHQPKPYAQNNLNKDIPNGESHNSSLSNFDISELNNIMKELGHPEQYLESGHVNSMPHGSQMYQPIIKPLPVQYVKRSASNRSSSSPVRPKSLASPGSSHHSSPQIHSNSSPHLRSNHTGSLRGVRSGAMAGAPQRKSRHNSQSSSLSSEPQSPIISSSSCPCSPPSPMFSPRDVLTGSLDFRPVADAKFSTKVNKPLPAHLQPGAQFGQFSPQAKRTPVQVLQKQHSLPETRECFGANNKETYTDAIPYSDTLPSGLGRKENTPSPSKSKHNRDSKDRKKDRESSKSKKERNNHKHVSAGANIKDRNVSTAERQRKAAGVEFSPPPLPPPPPDDLLPQNHLTKDDSDPGSLEMVGPLPAVSVPTQHALVFVNPAANGGSASFSPLLRASQNSAFQPLLNNDDEDEDEEANEDEATENSPLNKHHRYGGARPKDNAIQVEDPPESKAHKKRPSPGKSPKQTQTDLLERQNTDKSKEESETPNTSTPQNKRPLAPPFQVKRRQKFTAPPRLCRSLDYIPSDLEDTASLASRPDSPEGSKNNIPLLGPEAFMPITALVRQLADNISLSSMGSSEMSRSDPALNYDSAASAYESEYDNYRPGMASDEDYFIPEPISDVDLDLFDDINIDNVTVSDTYSLDMPLSLMASHMTSHHLQMQQLQQQQRELQQQQQQQQQHRHRQRRQEQAPDQANKIITDV